MQNHLPEVYLLQGYLRFHHYIIFLAVAVVAIGIMVRRWLATTAPGAPQCFRVHKHSRVILLHKGAYFLRCCHELSPSGRQRHEYIVHEVWQWLAEVPNQIFVHWLEGHAIGIDMDILEFPEPEIVMRLSLGTRRKREHPP